MGFYVYLLLCSDNRCTYIGATIDLNHRLRQHNKELVGGAKATGRKVGQGETWRRVAYVEGFPDWKSALQFEWRWKNMSRRINKPPMEKRIDALKQLLLLDRSTRNAVKFADWETPPNVIFEDEAWNALFVS
jgi:predicted GIY-YIG superfamily endonuclease